ncbi:Transcriptional coactivator Hfi1/Transcriptional adapter 1 [Phytophthora cinnamomi]|uniref:Transcriptional coactivator Hfi1/Transcriptional adapter 1 n=1 Tax=Phytophthora cinnamomi TaxID=4785 RepID=UPI00355A7702|nr:Transcriptional coactivator Hfi1/Transcriptional adapter 1 [Phytophthora cinnamomi]
MAERAAAESPMSNVQKLKLQLFHRLQRRHRDAWKRYWGSFQLYLAAKLSLEEFHALAEELLGPDKHLHNKFVVALLSTAYQDAAALRSPLPPSAPEIQDHNGEGGGQVPVEGGPSPTGSSDPLLQIIKEEGARHDSEQRSRVKQEPHEAHGRKRSHSSVAAADNNAEEAAVNKLMHLDRGNSHEHPDHHSAQLLMGLGKYATTISPSSIVITPEVAPSSSRAFQSSVSSDVRRG